MATTIYNFTSVKWTKKKKAIGKTEVLKVGNCKLLNPTEDHVTDTNMVKRNL